MFASRPVSVLVTNRAVFFFEVLMFSLSKVISLGQTRIQCIPFISSYFWFHVTFLRIYSKGTFKHNVKRKSSFKSF